MAEKWGFQIQSSLVSQHLTDAQYIQGGYIVVKDNTSRDKLPVKTETTDGVIIEGSLVYVSDDKKSYRYTNSAWVEENADIQIDNETIVKNSDDELVSTTKAFKPGSTATETYTVNEGLESGTNWSYTIDKIDESYKVSSVVMSSNNFPFTKVCNYEESDDNGETWTTNTQTSENQVSTDFTVTFDSVKIYKNIVFQFQWRSNPATAHTTSFGVMYDVVETTVVEDSVVDMQEKLNFTYDSEDGNKITAIDGHNLKYYKSDWNTTDVNEPTYIYNKPSFGLGLNLEQVDKTNPYNYIDIYKHNLITDEYIKLNTTSSAAIAFDFSEDTAEQCASTDDNVVEFIIKTKIPIDDFEQVSVTYITYSAQTTISLISDVGHLFTKPGNRGPVRDIQLWVKEKSYNEIKIGYTFGESSTITGADNSLYIGTSLTTYKLYDIASTNNVSVNYDNDTIKVNEEGKLYADIESGTTVEANPSDEAEETLSKIKIDDTIYSIDGSVVIPNVEFDYTDKDGNILPSGGTKVMIFRVSSTSDEYFDTKINEEGYRFYVNDNYFARYSTLNNRCLIINSDNEIVLYNKGATIGVTDQVSFEAYLTENYGTPVPVNGLRPLEISNIKIDDAAYRIVGQKYSGGNGIEISIDNVISSTIYANPTEEATEDLSKIKIGDTVYSVGSSEGPSKIYDSATDTTYHGNLWETTDGSITVGSSEDGYNDLEIYYSSKNSGQIQYYKINTEMITSPKTDKGMFYVLVPGSNGSAFDFEQIEVSIVTDTEGKKSVKLASKSGTDSIVKIERVYNVQPGNGGSGGGGGTGSGVAPAEAPTEEGTYLVEAKLVAGEMTLTYKPVTDLDGETY